MVYGEATITRDDRDITLKGQKEITIHVVESGYLFVGVEGEADKKVGEEVPALELPTMILRRSKLLCTKQLQALI